MIMGHVLTSGLGQNPARQASIGAGVPVGNLIAVVARGRAHGVATDAPRRAEVRRLDEHREPQRVDRAGGDRLRVVDTVAELDPAALRDACLLGDDLGHRLVHAHRGRQHTRAHIRQLEQLEHPLDGAVHGEGEGRP